MVRSRVRPADGAARCLALRQVLLNLQQAAKFTEHGESCCRSRFRLPTCRPASFEVCDTGIGMSDGNCADLPALRAGGLVDELLLPRHRSRHAISRNLYTDGGELDVRSAPAVAAAPPFALRFMLQPRLRHARDVTMPTIARIGLSSSTTTHGARDHRREASHLVCRHRGRRATKAGVHQRADATDLPYDLLLTADSGIDGIGCLRLCGARNPRPAPTVLMLTALARGFCSAWPPSTRVPGFDQAGDAGGAADACAGCEPCESGTTRARASISLAQVQCNFEVRACLSKTALHRELAATC